MQELDRKILEELIYERTRETVHLTDFMTLESELERSIERALVRSRIAPEEQGPALSRRYLTRAWSRVGQELIEDSDVMPIHDRQLTEPR
jgi:hypothetical protein